MRVKTQTQKNRKMIAKGEAKTLRKFFSPLNEETGATAVEYALLSALIAAVIAGTVALIGPALLPGFAAVIAGL